MSRIRGKNTQPERTLRSALHKLGLRFRLHKAGLPGKPDLVFARHKTVVFVHGCFWHRHPGCNIASTPKTNKAFWMKKFARNVARDREVDALLKALGWKVLVAWECELATAGRAQSTARSLAAEISSGTGGDPRSR
jgi:DNA mismatch endonuclease (patch repair protein)